MMKRNDGFTLVEMLVSIIAGTLATAAVATLLLLGIRMNAKTSEIGTRDNQVVIGLTVLSDIAKENNIIVDGTDVANAGNENPWSVKDQDENILFGYQPDKDAICVNDMPLIENVKSASIDGPSEKGLLKIVLTVDDEEYPLSVYCRMYTPEFTG